MRKIGISHFGGEWAYIFLPEKEIVSVAKSTWNIIFQGKSFLCLPFWEEERIAKFWNTFVSKQHSWEDEVSFVSWQLYTLWTCFLCSVKNPITELLATVMKQ